MYSVWVSVVNNNFAVPLVMMAPPVTLTDGNSKLPSPFATPSSLSYQTSRWEKVSHIYGSTNISHEPTPLTTAISTKKPEKKTVTGTGGAIRRTEWQLPYTTL